MEFISERKIVWFRPDECPTDRRDTIAREVRALPIDVDSLAALKLNFNEALYRGIKCSYDSVLKYFLTHDSYGIAALTGQTVEVGNLTKGRLIARDKDGKRVKSLPMGSKLTVGDKAMTLTDAQTGLPMPYAEIVDANGNRYFASMIYLNLTTPLAHIVPSDLEVNLNYLNQSIKADSDNLKKVLNSVGIIKGPFVENETGRLIPFTDDWLNKEELKTLQLNMDTFGKVQKLKAWLEWRGVEWDIYTTRKSLGAESKSSYEEQVQSDSKKAKANLAQVLRDIERAKKRRPDESK